MHFDKLLSPMIVNRPHHCSNNTYFADCLECVTKLSAPSPMSSDALHTFPETLLNTEYLYSDQFTAIMRYTIANQASLSMQHFSNPRCLTPLQCNNIADPCCSEKHDKAGKMLTKILY